MGAPVGPVTDSDGDGVHMHVDGLDRSSGLGSLVELFELVDERVRARDVRTDEDGSVWLDLSSQLPKR